MIFGKALISALSLTALTALAAPAPALAQAAQAGVNVTAGAQVFDTSGNLVGTITRVQGDAAVVKTDKHEVGVPVASFGKGNKGLALAMTQAELNAVAERQLAAAAAAMTVGATVLDPQGGTVGTISEIDATLVTLTLPSGAKARLPRSGFAATPQGPLLGMTAAQLEAQVSAAAPAPAATPAPSGQ